MVRGYLGIKGKTKEPKTEDKEAQLAELISLFQGGVLHG
jgi:hypothetical protein